MSLRIVSPPGVGVLEKGSPFAARGARALTPKYQSNKPEIDTLPGAGAEGATSAGAGVFVGTFAGSCGLGASCACPTWEVSPERVQRSVVRQSDRDRKVFIEILPGAALSLVPVPRGLKTPFRSIFFLSEWRLPKSIRVREQKVKIAVFALMYLAGDTLAQTQKNQHP